MIDEGKFQKFLWFIYLCLKNTTAKQEDGNEPNDRYCSEIAGLTCEECNKRRKRFIRSVGLTQKDVIKMAKRYNIYCSAVERGCDCFLFNDSSYDFLFKHIKKCPDLLWLLNSNREI